MDDVTFWRTLAMRQMADLLRERERWQKDRVRYREALERLMVWAKEQGLEQEAIAVLREPLI